MLRWDCGGRKGTMKKISIYLVIIFAVTSCNTALRVEKRIYTKGYYVEKKEHDKLQKDKVVDLENKKDDFQVANNEIIKSEKERDFITPTPKIETSPDDYLIASTNNAEYFIPNKEKHKSPNNNNSLVEKDKTIKSKTPLIDKIIKKYYKKENKKNTLMSNPGGLALIIIGVILMSAGTAIMWFLSILIGIILLSLGLIFFIIGAAIKHSKKNNSNSESKSNIPAGLQEIVYLKNGSMIKCTIIEQVIDDYIKIKTSDGSIYVYKMSEVEKIVKE